MKLLVKCYATLIFIIAANSPIFGGSILDSLETASWRYLNSDQLTEADSAAYLLLKEIQKSAVVQDSSLANAYFLLGTIEYFKARYRVSANFFEKSLELPYVNKNQSIQLNILNNLGATQSYLGKIPEALSAYQKALRIATALKDQESVTDLWINMADLEFEMGNYQNAIELSQKALKARIAPKRKASCHLNLGKYYTFDNQLEKGLWYTQEALRQFEALEDSYNLTAALINLAKIHQKKQELSASVKTMERAMDIAKKNTYDKFIASALIHLSQIIIQSGRNLSQAKDFAVEAIRLTKESGRREHLEEATLELSKYFAAVNDLEQFLLTIEEYNSIKKETANLNALAAAEELKVIYEVDQLTGKISFLQQNIQNKNRQLLVTLLGLIFASVAGGIIFYQYRRLKQNMKIMFQMNVNLAYAEHGTFESTEVEKEPSPSEPEEESAAVLYKMILRKIETKALYKDSSLGIQELARHMRRSKTSVSKAINNAGKTNFSGMINEFKVNEARRLILEKGHEMSMGDIATAAGFNTRISFNRHFKELTGFTPTDYLEMCNKNLNDNSKQIED